MFVYTFEPQPSLLLSKGVILEMDNFQNWLLGYRSYSIGSENIYCSFLYLFPEKK